MTRHLRAQICAPDRVSAGTAARIVECGRNAFERAVREGRISFEISEDGRRTYALADVLRLKSRN